MNILLENARNRLAKIWIIGSMIPFLILVVQSILGRYNDVQSVFSWFVPNCFPTLTLMISVVGAAALIPKQNRVVRKSFTLMCVGISIVYLSILTLILVLQPFSNMGDPIKLFTASNFFIAPMQALCVGALGFLFTTDAERQPGEVVADDKKPSA